MVGLGIVLESQKHGGGGGGLNKKSPQVISKATMIIKHHHQCRHHKSSSHPPLHPPKNFPEVPIFLQQCFLCKQTLLPGKDIYMYKGDRGFCSVECRQILMDEEESLKCSLAAMKVKPTSSSSSSSSSSSTSASRHHHRK